MSKLLRLLLLHRCKGGRGCSRGGSFNNCDDNYEGGRRAVSIVVVPWPNLYFQ